MTLIPGTEPFGFEGSEQAGTTGVLLVHGYTGSPQGLREWGSFLNGKGYTLLCPRLPGHGTTASDLHSVGWKDWVAEEEMALRGLFERCSSVFVAGLSMGGTITLDLASRFGGDLAGIILVNPFVYSTDPRRHLAPLLGKFKLLLPGIYNDVADPEQQEIGYQKISTKASLSVLQYGAMVRARLAQITVPTLVFRSLNDHVVPPGNADLVMETIASTDKRLVNLERSYHVATLDFDRQLIFDSSAEWIAAHVKS